MYIYFGGPTPNSAYFFNKETLLLVLGGDNMGYQGSNPVWPI